MAGSRSHLERLLGGSLVLLLSAFALSTAWDLIAPLLPTLITIISIASVAVVFARVVRWYRSYW